MVFKAKALGSGLRPLRGLVRNDELGTNVRVRLADRYVTAP